MNLINNSIVRGALAGTVATVPMTLAMTRLRRLLRAPIRQEPLPPEQITARVESRTGTGPVPGTHEIATIVAHFGYGALCGALYGGTANRLQTRSWLKGPLFGVGIWAISYLGWVPALRLMPNAKNDDAGRNTMMIASHLVWGFALSRLISKPPRELMAEVMAGVTGSSREARLAQKVFA